MLPQELELSETYSIDAKVIPDYSTSDIYQHIFFTTVVNDTVV